MSNCGRCDIVDKDCDILEARLKAKDDLLKEAVEALEKIAHDPGTQFEFTWVEVASRMHDVAEEALAKIREAGKA